MPRAWHSCEPVNPTQYSEDNPRTVPFQPPASVSGSGTVQAPEPKTKYIELPVSAERLRGPRNLAWGVILLALAALVYWMGLYLAGRGATRLMVASFGTFGLLWILYKLRVLRQRHGTLMAFGIIALFAAVIPFAERGLQNLDALAKSRLAGQPDSPSRDDASVPDAATQPAHSAQPRIPPVPNASASPQADDIVRELILPPPDASAKKLVRFTQDAQVVIGGRKFRISAGSRVPFTNFSDGVVTIVANGQEVNIDQELVAFTGKSSETPAEINRLAMEELRRRYPGIFEKGTPENDVFVARTEELKKVVPDFFNNPRWPLELGEQLAAQEKWTRADQPSDDAAPEQPNASPAQESPPPAPK